MKRENLDEYLPSVTVMFPVPTALRTPTSSLTWNELTSIFRPKRIVSMQDEITKQKIQLRSLILKEDTNLMVKKSTCTCSYYQTTMIPSFTKSHIFIWRPYFINSCTRAKRNDSFRVAVKAMKIISDINLFFSIH